MAPKPGLPVPALATGDAVSLAERLERGQIIYYPVCPIALPEGADRQFLLTQRLGRMHKNISYDPHTGMVHGFRRRNTSRAERLRDLLAFFSRKASAWVADLLPPYATRWQLDRVSFRPEEEATRRLRVTARNDLVHVDAFPTRPTKDRRLLRLFVNLNETDPRVWVTSEPFARLLERYGTAVGLPTLHALRWPDRLRQGVASLFQPGGPRSPYDAFMLRLHDFLKANDDFQEHCPKRYWNFQPGSAWLVMTDSASHAALRGRFAIEHSYFIAQQTLALPAESPLALLERACGTSALNRAA